MKKEVYQGLTYFEYLALDWWRARRAKAIREAGYRCQTEGCESMDLHLHVHHLNYRNLGNEATSDLQVLCRKCHKEIHNATTKED